MALIVFIQEDMSWIPQAIPKEEMQIQFGQEQILDKTNRKMLE